jgi:hypothetical protein
MPVKNEKRADERFASNAAVIFTYFSIKNWSEDHSVTINLSADGMCFESRHSFKPGANLYIRTGQNPEMALRICNQNLLRRSTLAEVKWCQKITRKDETCFRVGVKYF